MCWHIPNDSLRSYMMEADLPLCVLIYQDGYVGLHYWKLVKSKQKIADLLTKISKTQSWFFDIVLRHPRGLFKVIYDDGNWSFTLWYNLFRCLYWSSGQKIGQNESKIADFGTKYPENPILVPWYCAKKSWINV